jgi:hypothetical protein
MVNTKVCATSCELGSFELSSIVRQDSSEHAKSVDDALQELNCCFPCYVYHWSGLHPFGERIDADE